jgi:hypothetical protein
VARRVEGATSPQPSTAVRSPAETPAEKSGPHVQFGALRASSLRRDHAVRREREMVYPHVKYLGPAHPDRSTAESATGSMSGCCGTSTTAGCRSQLTTPRPVRRSSWWSATGSERSTSTTTRSPTQPNAALATRRRPPRRTSRRRHIDWPPKEATSCCRSSAPHPAGRSGSYVGPQRGSAQGPLPAAVEAGATNRPRQPQDDQ